MMDAFHIFYHSFLEPDDKALFKEPARNILNTFSLCYSESERNLEKKTEAAVDQVPAIAIE